jgi:hypothetical protein
MKYQDYRIHIFKGLNAFDRIFHPEKKWRDVKLSDLCPCKDCDVYKEYEEKALYGSVAERQYAEFPDTCPCMDKIQWDMECMEKFAWYENNDERLK